MSQPKVGIIMGSTSDLKIMSAAAEVLDQLGVPNEVSVASAHRAPELAASYAKSAEERGIQVIIAGAGGAAHLPGVVAALTPLPVIGVPCRSVISIDGWDSLLSIAQMPPGIPVATVGLDAAQNAGILAAQIIGTSDAKVREAIKAYKKKLHEGVVAKAEELKTKGWRAMV